MSTSSIENKDLLDRLLLFIPDNVHHRFKIYFTYGKRQKVIEIDSNYIPSYFRDYLNRLIKFIGTNPSDEHLYLKLNPTFTISLEVTFGTNQIIIAEIEKRLRPYVIEEYYEPYCRFLEEVASVRLENITEMKEEYEIFKRIVENHNFSEEFIKQYIDKIDGYDLWKFCLMNSNLSENFYHQNISKWIDDESLLFSLGQSIKYKGTLYNQLMSYHGVERYLSEGLLYNKTVPEHVKASTKFHSLASLRSHGFAADRPENEYSESIKKDLPNLRETNWVQLSGKKNLSEKFYLDYIENIIQYPSTESYTGPLAILCRNISLSENFFRHIISLYPDKFTKYEWSKLCKNTTLSIFFYRDYIQTIIDKGVLKYLFDNPTINEDFIEELFVSHPTAFTKEEWIYIIMYADISENFIRKYLSTILELNIIRHVLYNFYLREEFIQELIHKYSLHSYSVLINPSLSEDFFNQYIEDKSKVPIIFFQNKHYYNKHWLIKEFERTSITNRYSKELLSKEVSDDTDIIKDLSDIIASYNFQ
jgi:hypothetical protein